MRQDGRKFSSSVGCLWVFVFIVLILFCSLEERSNREREELKKQIHQMKEGEKQKGNNHWGEVPKELERTRKENGMKQKLDWKRGLEGGDAVYFIEGTPVKIVFLDRGDGMGFVYVVSCYNIKGSGYPTFEEAQDHAKSLLESWMKDEQKRNEGQ